MILAQSAAELEHEIARLRGAGKRIALVPTMGNLHAGHRSLLEQARREAKAVVASIYVNPLQFGPQEDFKSYPRTLDQDRVMLTAAQVDLLFLPNDAAIYPRGQASTTRVEVPGLSDILCGASRPGHFRGVATVVHRLFQMVKPDVALFGKKDYQQLQVICRMTADFGLPIEIVGVDTVRDPDGLALSSRNAYLTAVERRIAPQLYANLQLLARQLSDEIRLPKDLASQEQRVVAQLNATGLRAEYVSVRRQHDLQAPEPEDQTLVILAAAWLGKTRLIDNLEFELKPAK